MNQLILLIILPLLGAFLMPVLQRSSTALTYWSGPLILLFTCMLGLNFWPQLTAGPQALAVGGFRPPLGITLYADYTALLFVLALHLGCLLFWTAWDHGADAMRRRALSLLMVAAGSGMSLSGDLFNIYVFYELLAVATYGLVIGPGSAAAYASAIRYLVISAFGAAMILLGIALVYAATGSLNLAQLAQLAPAQLDNAQGMAAFILMLVGFGVKAELFAVNTWVPEVYSTAPRRLAALLAGVVSKLALLIILRLLVLLFPYPESYQVLMVLGILGVITGELAAYRSQDVARMLAYSSIAQLGIIFIAFSIPGEAGIIAGLAVALHHMLVKPGLFLLAHRWGGSISRLAGAGRASPVAAAMFVLLALSAAGVPPLPGFWAKLLIIMPLAGQGAGLSLFALAVILLAVVLEVGYLFRVVSVLYRSDQQQPAIGGHNLSNAVTTGALSMTLLISMVMLPELNAQLELFATQFADVTQYIETVAPVALHPGGVMF
jgi:formate hydrogenlyase subunit 3/multisubunit Na+/H+ antiporter MnhD subunit